MSQTDDPLLSLLMDNVPFKFINDFNQKLPLLYAGVYNELAADPLLMEEEVKFELPYRRRAVCETAFRRTALDAGLHCRDLKHNAGNCNYVLVQCEKIVLTQVAVREGEGIRPAKSRDQHSAVNQFLLNPGFAFIDSPSLSLPAPVYATIVHGPDRKDSTKNAFAYLIFPPCKDASADTPVFKYSLAMLLQEYKNHVLDREKQIAPQERKQPKIKGKGTSAGQ